MVLKFDLSSVPELEGATIHSAELQLYAESAFVNSTSGASTLTPHNGPKEIYASSYDWSGDVTWKSYYGYDYIPLANATPAFSPDIPVEGWDFRSSQYHYFAPPASNPDVLSIYSFPGPETQVLFTNNNANVGCWESFTVTSAVQGFIESPRWNYGFIMRQLRQNYEDIHGVIYTSSEGDPQHRPKLIIDYTPSGVVTKKFALTVNASNGTVTVSPSASTFDSGTVVTLTAAADDGYQFIDWNGDASGSEMTTTVIMDAAKSVTASFMKTTGVSQSVFMKDQISAHVEGAQLQIHGLDGPGIVEIYSASGKRLVCQSVNGPSAVMLDDVPPGSFTVRVTGAQGTTTQRIMIGY